MARPNLARIAVAIPYRALSTTSDRRGACPEDACGVAHVLVHARYGGGETDGGDRWRRGTNCDMIIASLREHEFERTERPLIGDGEQTEQADGDAREPHPGVHDGLREPPPGNSEKPIAMATGILNSVAQRHWRDDAHVQRDEDDARDVLSPEREVEDKAGRKVFQCTPSRWSCRPPVGDVLAGSSETARGRNNVSPFTW